jgi:UDP-2,3-diacylglucosamine pyrophosphatase LpxH
MIIARKETAIGTPPLQSPRAVLDFWRTWARMRLSAVFEAAKEVSFDDASRIVFFSDCHRGDNSRADAFARNEELFLDALTYYYHEGFSYIEVGDGDEMWKNGHFGDILDAHKRTFDQLHKFNRGNRLHLILGNHDIQGSRHNRVEKDGILAEEGLILRHTRTGQRIFVVHGHQADFKSDALYVIGRFAVRHIWRRLQLLGFEAALRGVNGVRKSAQARIGSGLETGFPRRLTLKISQIQRQTERQLRAWAEAYRQIVICGHTHRPMFATHGAPPYFNTGSCVFPGVITGLELRNGELAPVKWSCRPETKNGKTPHTERQLMAPPRKLRLL